ncbi:orotidine-5'-phosphate decarboxylase [Psittacicella hinzii]|uniref:orotidine-5'-phosphate decarboxylase n=1 Tax=Psittacicella hinzii TaxID=2028575 RepID=UPI0011C3FD5A|nr:orotidine-5'-phosphate decarboxylase [Psittacicella hinzii]
MSQVIIALDFPTSTQTLEFLQQFDNRSLFVKVGMELYLQNSPSILAHIKALGHKIFLDIKLHDIPNTVYGAAKGLAQFKIDLLTVHAAGGMAMLTAAKQGMIDGGSPDTKVIAITQLTSTSEQQMHEQQGISGSLLVSVLRYAKISQQAGLDGVVCSAQEAAQISQVCGADFLKVTPGIRGAQDQVGDQQRVATPAFAKQQGASYIVVGRPITRANDPVAAYDKFVQEFTA